MSKPYWERRFARPPKSRRQRRAASRRLQLQAAAAGLDPLTFALKRVYGGLRGSAFPMLTPLLRAMEHTTFYFRPRSPARARRRQHLQGVTAAQWARLLRPPRVLPQSTARPLRWGGVSVTFDLPQRGTP